MNNRQIHVMQLLRENDRMRHLYEGAHPQNSRVGSGRYFVTYSAVSPELTRAEVDELLRLGLIELYWPDKPDLHMYRATSREESSRE